MTALVKRLIKINQLDVITFCILYTWLDTAFVSGQCTSYYYSAQSVYPLRWPVAESMIAMGHLSKLMANLYKVCKLDYKQH